jgi:ABC-type spermidine/putrescine transport system permease subunit II
MSGFSSICACVEELSLVFEHRSSLLLPKPQFVHRLARSALVATVTLVVSLPVGMAGYYWFEHMPWIDACANAAMILSGMGPLVPLETVGEKIFRGDVRPS